MHKFLGLRTVAYKVPDLQKAKDWYSSAFKHEPYFDESFYVGYRIGGYELGLLPTEDETSITGNSVLAYWGVEDIEESIRTMLDMGAGKIDEAQDVGGGVIVASVSDPWGNIIGLIYNPHFKIQDS